MDTLNRGVLSAMSSAVAAQRNATPDHRARAAVTAYAAMLSERAGVQITDEQLDALAEGGCEGLPNEMGVREWRELLAPVTSLIEQRSGRPINRETAADYRVAAVTRAGLLEHAMPTLSLDSGSSGVEERFLDAEIIAAYW